MCMKHLGRTHEGATPQAQPQATAWPLPVHVADRVRRAAAEHTGRSSRITGAPFTFALPMH